MVRFRSPIVVGQTVPARDDIRFGSFKEVVGTAVYREPWWFRTVLDATVAGSVFWVNLGDWVRMGPREASPSAALDTAWFHSTAQAPDAAWFCEHAPIALGLTPEPAVCAFDLIATRVENRTSVAYPFLVREMDGSIFCGFSDAGPDVDVRDSIVNALAGRFLWAARPA